MSKLIAELEEWQKLYRSKEEETKGAGGDHSLAQGLLTGIETAIDIVKEHENQWHSFPGVKPPLIGSIYYVQLADGRIDTDEWRVDDWANYLTVIAWQELPDKYVVPEPKEAKTDKEIVTELLVEVSTFNEIVDKLQAEIKELRDMQNPFIRKSSSIAMPYSFGESNGN
jgi:hypothetical protein